MLGITGRLGLDDSPIDVKLLSKSIEGAQKRIESNNFARRKHVLTYDDVMNQQRMVIYKQRQDVLFEENIKEKIEGMIAQSVSSSFEQFLGGDEPNPDGFSAHYFGFIPDKKNYKYTSEELDSIDRDEWRDELIESALRVYREKDKLFVGLEGVPQDAMREIEKSILLKSVDLKWMEHLDDMEELKDYIGLNSYAQRDPVAMYRIQGAEIFDQMIADIREDTVRKILSVSPKMRQVKRVQVANPTSAGFAGEGVRRKPIVKKVKVGRNEDCPCGSGRKYKKCCGRDGANLNN